MDQSEITKAIKLYYSIKHIEDALISLKSQLTKLTNTMTFENMKEYEQGTKVER